MTTRHNKLIWQIFPVNIIILLTVMAATSWYGSSTLRNFYNNQMGTALENRAYLIRSQISSFVTSGNIDDLREFTMNAGRESQTRITVIAPDGKVLSDSDENPDTMDRHHDRPEIIQAFKRQTGLSIRFSKTLRQTMLYVAVPLHASRQNDRAEMLSAPSTVLRVSIPMTAINEEVRNVQRRIAIGSLVVVLAAAIVTLLVSRRISRPLEEMKHSAERFAQGDFSRKLILRQENGVSLEVASLAHSLNEMALQLNDRINTIISQRNALEAVFSSMVESVLAVDREDRIMSINRACAELFHVDQQETQGKLIQEVIRNVTIQDLIDQVLRTRKQHDEEIVLQDGTKERYLQSHGVPLNDGEGKNMGVLVVMNDVTDIRRLENVRKDFVANVSHELKTPITSIKGYVETLLDGALNDPENAGNFLRIVMKQTDRLHAIIEDLLSLSRIEKDHETGEVSLSKGYLKPLLSTVIQLCQMKADQKKLQIHLECRDDLTARMNPSLLEQAVVNLVVNAIKYSHEDGEIFIEAFQEEQKENQDFVLIEVRDNGIGIAQKHIPRLFERFYRSDKARSRSLGGTGLGLSIVKHIVQAHHGQVTVESEEGKGTTFTILLPANRDN